MEKAIIECESTPIYVQAKKHNAVSNHRASHNQVSVTEPERLSATVDGCVRVKFANSDTIKVGHEGTDTGGAEIIEAF